MGILDDNSMPRTSTRQDFGGGGGGTPSVTVTFNLNGGIGDMPPLTVSKGTLATKPKNDPTKDKHTFGGWYTDSKLTTAFDVTTTPVTTNLTLYAKWNLFNHFTVTFNTSGGTGNDGTGNNGAAIAEQIIEKDGTATLPTTKPTLAGLAFVDWYTNPAPTSASTPFTFTTPITTNTILYAGWKATVTFNTHIATKPVFSGSTIARPKNPTKRHYVFVDWYADSALTKAKDFTAPVTKDTPIYAGWASTWSMVAAGNSHTAGIKADGTLWAWGWNTHGQLGLGDTNERTRPVQVGDATWSMVSASRRHAVGIKKDGTLWAWGDNDDGQLGLGNRTNQTSLTQVGDATWSTVATGSGHTVGIKAEDGTLWAWGDNDDGQLGLGNKTDKTSPTQVGSDTWKAVTTGHVHAVGIKADGTLWAWGDNTHGQLGLGNKTDKTSPQKVGMATWKAVTAGRSHTVGIKKAEDGTLWAWGDNTHGQLGLGNKTDKTSPQKVGMATWKAVTTGRVHAVGIKADGTLWAWGDNTHGQLGLGNKDTKTSPTKVGSATWKAVTARRVHAVGIKNDNTLWAWGDNTHGQLGLGHKANQSSPTLVMEAPTTP